MPLELGPWQRTRDSSVVCFLFCFFFKIVILFRFVLFYLFLGVCWSVGRWQVNSHWEANCVSPGLHLRNSKFCLFDQITWELSFRIPLAVVVACFGLRGGALEVSLLIHCVLSDCHRDMGELLPQAWGLHTPSELPDPSFCTICSFWMHLKGVCEISCMQVAGNLQCSWVWSLQRCRAFMDLSSIFLCSFLISSQRNGSCLWLLCKLDEDAPLCHHFTCCFQCRSLPFASGSVSVGCNKNRLANVNIWRGLPSCLQNALMWASIRIFILL